MRRIFLLSLWFLILLMAPGFSAAAGELTPELVYDDSGRTVTVAAREGEEIGALYIKWDNPVVPYQIKTAQSTLLCGENGFLHEYIPLPEKSPLLTILFPEQTMKPYEVRIFADEEVPEDVQIWQPPCPRADIMLVSAHADDEILFMGGIIPTYAAEGGARVQVVYMTEFWSTTPVREHEKLDGLWTDGLRTYPVCGGFPDIYAEDMEQAKKVYDLQAMTDYLTDVIRQFRPQIVVTHDFNGEYGHGFHRLTAEATARALEAAAETDSIDLSGNGSPPGLDAWDVPKAYFHLYPEHSIHMNLNVPLEAMGGRTALEVAKEAYGQHVSQQWCWFYVSDTYKYSCADFGLYRTKVGYDTADDMLENIVLYSEQEEQERLALEEQKRLALEEQERLRLQEQQERAQREEESRQEQLRRSEKERLDAEALMAEEAAAGKQGVFLLEAVLILAVLTLWCVRRIHRRKSRRRRK